MPNTDPDEVIPVSAGVIRNADGNVLLSQRMQGRHQQGKWEFPGGKREADETPEAALIRELREELGIEVNEAQPRIQLIHQYPDIKVLLEVFDVTRYSGEPYGVEEQNIRWVPLDELGQYDYPAANLAVISSLQLPSIYAISNISGDGEQEFMHKLERRLKAGLQLVQLREHSLDSQTYSELAQNTARLVHKHGAKLMLNTDNHRLIEDVGADGLHLTSRQLMNMDQRPVPDHRLLSVSCHDTAELKQADELGANFAVLSPVKKTRSHPEAVAIGWERFSDILRQCRFPVYALGGMACTDLQQARKHGAQGIALLSAAWQEDFLDCLQENSSY